MTYPATVARLEKPGYRPLVPAAGVILIAVTAISFLAPLLVPMSADLNVSLGQAGQLAVASAISWALGSPFMGLISDRFGRRPTIVAALVGLGVTSIAGALVTNYWALFATRLIAGFFASGGPPTVVAALGDLYPIEQRGRALGWANSGFGFAMLLGVPLIGAAGGLWGWRAAFVVMGLALFAVALLVRLSFPGGRPDGAGSGNPIRAYRHLFRLPNLGLILTANACERVTFMAMTLYFASLLIQSFALDPVTVAPALALVAVGAIAGNIAGGFLADRYPRPGVVAICLILSGLFGLVTFAWPVRLELAVIAGLGFGLANAAGRPALFGLAVDLSDRHRGALLGLIAFAHQVGWAAGAGLGGAVIGLAGYGGLGGLILLATLAASGLILALPTAQRRPSDSPAVDV